MNAGTELVPKKGSHSVVWKYFGFKQDDEGQANVNCKACSAIVAAPQSNTTNLYQHLKRHHKVQSDEAVQGKKSSESHPTTQTSITDTLHNATPCPRYSSRSNITDTIAYHLAKDMVPINNSSLIKGHMKRNVLEVPINYVWYCEFVFVSCQYVCNKHYIS